MTATVFAPDCLRIASETEDTPLRVAAEDERPGADGQDPGSASDGVAKKLPDLGGHAVGRHRRHRNQVCGRRALQTVLHDQREAHARAHRPRDRRDEREVEDREPVVGPVDAEHLAEHAELEGGDPVGDHGRDAGETHGGEYGRKLTKAGSAATRGGIATDAHLLP